MIGDAIVLGSGGESATIIVNNTVQTDAVSASNGVKTIQGVWKEFPCDKYEPLIPTMTSNTTPSGIASSSASASGQAYRAYYAFDGNNATLADVHYGSAYSLGTKIRYAFEEPVNIDKFSLFGHIDGTSATLTSGAIYYTTDGSTWQIGVELTSSNFTSGVMNEYFVSLENVIGIQVGAISSSSSRGLIVNTFQAYEHITSEYHHEIPRIGSYGDWVVSAVRSGATAQSTVSVDEATSFNTTIDWGE